jgi:hypothetical protein
MYFLIFLQLQKVMADDVGEYHEQQAPVKQSQASVANADHSECFVGQNISPSHRSKSSLF